MKTGLKGSETGLIYYFRFDEGLGSLAKSSAYDMYLFTERKIEVSNFWFGIRYGLLGGGSMNARPQYVPSTAPISAPPSGSQLDNLRPNVVGMRLSSSPSLQSPISLRLPRFLPLFHSSLHLSRFSQIRWITGRRGCYCRSPHHLRWFGIWSIDWMESPRKIFVIISFII